MGKHRMQEPWGFRDTEGYQGSKVKFDNILDSFFADAKYDDNANIVHFYNKDGEEVASLDISDLRTKDLIESAKYVDGYIVMTFSNGDVINIDVRELLDEGEFSDGLKVVDGVVSVKIDEESEKYITVSGNGIKLSGIDDAIDTKLKSVKERLEDLREKLSTKADKEHKHVLADITDVDLDDSGVVLEDEKINGTVVLNAGRF